MSSTVPASTVISSPAGTFTITGISAGGGGSSTAVDPSSTSSNSNNNNNNAFNSGSPGSFYRNLFYILIGLLVAFGIVSFLSLLRARRRRNAIVREADRLGVMVPGLPGYIPVRERQHLQWSRSAGGDHVVNPDWWEVEGKEKEKGGNNGYTGAGDSVVIDMGYGNNETSDLRPLALIPTVFSTSHEPPVPQSDIPFFPNHLAYRINALQPPPARFSDTASPETLEQLRGEALDVVTIIRMPTQAPSGAGVDAEIPEGEEVLREWSGVELGIVRVDVAGDR